MEFSSQLQDRDSMQEMLKNILQNLHQKNDQMTSYTLEENENSKMLVSFVQKVVTLLIDIIKNCQPAQDISGEMGEDIKKKNLKLQFLNAL